MNEIITTFGSAITSFVSQLGEAIKKCCETVLYDTSVVEGVTTKTLSTTAQVLLTFAGIAVATGLVLGFVRLIKHH